MVAYWSCEVLLDELGDKAEWRRLYRSMVHYSVRHVIQCYAHVTGVPLSYTQVKGYLRGYSMSHFGVETRLAFFARRKDVADSLQATLRRNAS